MDIDADQLLTFLAVAEQGSLTGAARLLHRGQPAVSERLQKLAEQVGEPLYERHGHGIRLTPTGQALLAPARQVRAALGEVAAEIVRRRRLNDRVLRIAATPVLAHYFLPAPLAGFQAQHAGVRVHVKGVSHDWRQIAFGDWDVFFPESDFAIEALPPYYSLRPWHIDPIACVVSPRHPLAAGGRIDWEDLLRFPVIWREPGSGIRSALEKAFAAQGLTAPFLIEVNGVDGLGAAAAAGAGIGFVAQTVLRQRPDWGLQVLAWEPPVALSWTLYLAAPDEPYRSPAVRSFLNGILSAAPGTTAR